MKVIMLKTVKGNGFSFVEGQKYKALDGDGLGVEELKEKILVKQPNSPRDRAWWSAFDKSCTGMIFTVLSFSGGRHEKHKRKYQYNKEFYGKR